MKITADGVEFAFPENWTMGELRILKRDFDLVHPKFIDIDGNLDHVAGVLFIAMKRKMPKYPDAAIMEQVNAVQSVEFDATDEEKAAAEAEASGPPTEPVASPGESGN